MWNVSLWLLFSCSQALTFWHYVPCLGGRSTLLHMETTSDWISSLQNIFISFLFVGESGNIFHHSFCVTFFFLVFIRNKIKVISSVPAIRFLLFLQFNVVTREGVDVGWNTGPTQRDRQPHTVTVTQHASFWSVGGSQRAPWGNPHTQRICKLHRERSVGSNPGPFFCESTVLTTDPLSQPACSFRCCNSLDIWFCFFSHLKLKQINDNGLFLFFVACWLNV